MTTTYRKKRHFDTTPEPSGSPRAKTNKKRIFVVQKHNASHLHYDFRLELQGTLKSWAVPKGPSKNPAIKRLAIQVENHPLAYASFEGVIPKGQYGAGTVKIWDKGTWECIGPPSTSYKKGSMTFELFGKKLTGRWKLIRIKTEPTPQWLLFKLGKDK
jgi:bifunctional non-homologous end joining protein LigD